MNCPNCGRELAEGEVCNCTANVNETENTTPAAPAPEAASETAPAAEQPQPQYTPEPEQPQYVPAQEQPQYAPAQETYYTPPIMNAEANYYNPQQMPVMQPVVARTDYPEGYKIKKKTVAVILAVTLGALGIHNFYLGNNNKALAQLLICTLGSLLAGIGFFASLIWAIIEAVLIFTEKQDMDANGYKIMTFEESVAKAIKESKEAEEKE